MAEEHQESIFDKCMAPLQDYVDAQLNLLILNRRKPLPTDYELRKTMYEAQMISAELEIKKIINIQ